jgi:hypothetical protein
VRSIFTRDCPSKVTHASVRASGGSDIVILALPGKMIGRNEREWGQMGVTLITLASECTIEPPQLRLYAVLPVGVEIRTPSP